MKAIQRTNEEFVFKTHAQIYQVHKKFVTTLKIILKYQMMIKEIAVCTNGIIERSDFNFIIKNGFSSKSHRKEHCHVTYELVCKSGSQ